MNRSRRHLLLGTMGAMGASLLGARFGSAKDAGAKGKNLLVVFVQGGWDITYALDPKPGISTIDAPDGDVATIGGVPIYSDASRPNVRAFFEDYGAASTIVNGIQVQSINHPDCSKRMLTGTASETNPDFGAITAYELGRDLPAPYLALGPTAFTGPLGSITVRTGTITQVKGLMDSASAYPELDPAQSRFLPSDGEAKLIDAYVRASAERLRATRGARGYNAKRIDDFLQSLDRGKRFETFKNAMPAELSFSLDLKVQIDIALRALSEGLSHTVHLEAAFSGWDTHVANDTQGDLHEGLFDGLRQLADQLSSKPGKASGSTMLDETVVAVVSEMGRTPKLNMDGGKDHWPVTSALLFGGGLKGGRAIGLSGHRLEAKPIDFATGAPDDGGDLLQYSNFVAGLLTAVGVDPAPYLPQAEPFHALVS